MAKKSTSSAKSVTINRSAKTGRFVPKEYVKTHKSTTVTERRPKK